MSELPKLPTTDNKPPLQKSVGGSFAANAEAFVKYYQLIAIILVIVLVIAGGTGLYALYGSNIDSLKFEKERAAKVLSDKQTEMEKLKNIKIGYETIELSGQKILDILPLEKDIPSILVQLETMANSNNLSMSALNISEPLPAGAGEEAQAAKVKQVILTVSLIGGNYFDLKNYLADLEKNMRLMDVRSIVYTPASKTYSLTVNAYYAED